MKYTEPPKNLPVVPPPPVPPEPKPTETEPKEAVHFRDPRAGDTLGSVPVSGGNARSGTPASRSLQPIRISMTATKERPIRAPDDLLTVPEVAERLRRSRSAVRRLIARRSLPVYDISGGYLFKAADVEAFLESRRTEARPSRQYGRP